MLCMRAGMLRRVTEPGRVSSPEGRRWTVGTRRLLVVVAAYVLVQLLIVGIHARLGWDESIYVSQFGRHAPPTWFGAPRARGVTLVAAPVVALTASTVVLRLWLIAVSALAIFAAFHSWTRLVRSDLVAYAAAGFVTLWVTEFYGAQVMPNLYVALGAVAAAAFTVRALRAEGWWPLLGAALTTAWVALVRPSDALWLTLGFLVVVAYAARRPPRAAATRTAAALLLGFAAGAGEWLVEAAVRFGGVGVRLHEASQQNGGGLSFSLLQQARAANGPVLCRPCHVNSPLIVGAAWWLVVAALVTVAVLATRREADAVTTTVPTAGAIAVAAGYVLLLSYAAPRFLLPAYGLLSIPAAIGAPFALAFARSRWSSSVVTATTVLLAVLFVGEQAAVLVYQDHQRATADRVVADVVRVLKAHGIRTGCTIAGPVTYQIVYAAGCRDDYDAIAQAHGQPARDDGDDTADAVTAGAFTGRPTANFAFIVSTRDQRHAPSEVRHWHRVVVDHAFVVELPAHPAE